MVHVTALGIWVGTIAMTGAAAGVLFPQIKALAPTTAVFEKYTGEHWLLIAGRPASRIFAISDMVQFSLALIVLLSFIGLYTSGSLRRHWATAIHTIGLSIIIAVFCYYMLVLAPRMDMALKAFWTAAENGAMDAAAKHRAAFDADHPVASRLYSVLAFVLLGTTLAAAWPQRDERAEAQ